MKIQPCENCNKKEFCDIYKFLNSHKEIGPWKIDKWLRENTRSTELYNADKDYILLECIKCEPLKAK